MALAVIGGYFGLGTVRWTPGTVLATLAGVFVAALVFSFMYETFSRRRWVI
jgi:uncharacterized membrane protein YfcA